MATDWKIAMNAFAHKTIFTLNSIISAITTCHVQLFLHFCIIHWAHRIWCNLEAWSACSKILCSALSDPVKYIFVHIFINFDIFHQKETAVVLLSQLDRQTRNFGGGCGGRLTFIKATYNYSKSSWHAERSNLSMSFNYTDKEEKNVQQHFWKERRGGEGIDKNFALDGQTWNWQSSAAWAAASAGRRQRPATESISPLSGRMICRRHAAIAGCYHGALRKQEI